MAFTARYSWWLGAMATLAIVLQAASQFGMLGPAQGVVLTVTEPIDRSLNAVFEPVASFLSTDAGELREENQLLREENADLQRRMAELEIDAARVGELESALNITTTATEATYEAADRIALDRSPGHSVMTINKGSDSGIAPGMIVLSAQGTVVGKVTDVSGGHAFVRLLDDSRSRANVRILESDVEGTLEGTLGRSLSLTFVQAAVRVGETVVTSGLGGGFPPDLVVGRVAGVSGTDQDLYRQIEVDPAVRLSTVRTVLVLTSFEPGEDE